MKRRTIIPCWAIWLVAGGEKIQVVQTGICSWAVCEARIRRYFIAERGQVVERFLSMERMNEKDAELWLNADERGDVQRAAAVRADRRTRVRVVDDRKLIPLRYYEP